MHKKTWISWTLLLFMPSLAWGSIAGEVNKANGLYKQGKFDDSLELYQKALDQDDKSSVIKYDLGTALYKKGDYLKALDYLQQAAEDKSVKIKPKAEYNLGNVLYKSGIQKENTNVDEAIKSLQEALGYYGESIADDPKDRDALYNQDFVKKEIERLKQKKQEQQKQQRQNQSQNQKQQQQDQQNKQNQQGQKNQQNKQDQKNQEGQQKKQEQQQNQQSQQGNSKDQKSQQASSESLEKKEKKAQESVDKAQKEIDRKQAEDLLEDYRENEEPKKLLNYMPKKIDDRSVLRDW